MFYAFLFPQFHSQVTFWEWGEGGFPCLPVSGFPHILQWNALRQQLHKHSQLPAELCLEDFCATPCSYWMPGNYLRWPDMMTVLLEARAAVNRCKQRKLYQACLWEVSWCPVKMQIFLIPLVFVTAVTTPQPYCCTLGGLERFHPKNFRLKFSDEFLHFRKSSRTKDSEGRSCFLVVVMVQEASGCWLSSPLGTILEYPVSLSHAVSLTGTQMCGLGVWMSLRHKHSRRVKPQLYSGLQRIA